MKAIHFVTVFAFACAVVWAQAISQIQGVVEDSSGAAIPGVEIKATQVDTGTTRTATSAEDGRYVLPNLPIGPYRLEVNKPGAIRNSRDVGVKIERNRADLTPAAASRL